MKPPARASREPAPKRVLLIGWDAADWQMIHPAIERGWMPTLASLMQRGVWGNLATTRPILSPMLWNTIATGKRPREHGVHGFTEPDPDGAGVRPTTSTSRKCKAVWNLLSHYGLRSNVVGWYASHPAEPIDGVMVSNQFEHFRLEGGEPTPPPRASVHPAERSEELAAFRVHPGEIDASAMLPFVPMAAALAQRGERHTKRLGKLQQMLAQTATVHAAATHLMAETDWDFTAVYYEGIDRFGHEFMEFHPPKMDQVDDEDFEAYRGCMAGIYRFHDMMLQTLLDLAGDDTAVLLISDHGYYNDHLRPDPREGKSGPVEWHRPFGVFAACGPGVAAGARLFGATILDVAPTLLELFGLPAAYDMPGRVLAEVLEETTPLERIESWEEVDGPCGMHPEDLRVDPEEARAALEQLVALGYVEAPGEDAAESIDKTVRSNRFQLIQSLIDAGDHPAAIELLESFGGDEGESAAVQMLLAGSLLAIGDRERARSVLEPMIARDPDSPRVRMMLGTLEFSCGDADAALEHLAVVERAEPRLPGLHTKLGSVLIDKGRFDRAIEAFEKALAIDGDSPLALVGRARARLETGDPEGALEDAMLAGELVHQLPRAHYLVGRAHLAMGRPHDAIEALELCVHQAPRMAVAQRALASAYRETGEESKARDAEMRATGVTTGPATERT
ncbi:MAG: alkaline phosphatase family protein [Planctomycetota bacterium]